MIKMRLLKEIKVWRFRVTYCAAYLSLWWVQSREPFILKPIFELGDVWNEE